MTAAPLGVNPIACDEGGRMTFTNRFVHTGGIARAEEMR
jgi:hypothetical protein